MFKYSRGRELVRLSYSKVKRLDLVRQKDDYRILSQVFWGMVSCKTLIILDLARTQNLDQLDLSYLYKLLLLHILNLSYLCKQHYIMLRNASMSECIIFNSPDHKRIEVTFYIDFRWMHMDVSLNIWIKIVRLN